MTPRVLLFLAALTLGACGRSSLAELEASLERDYAAIAHIPPEALAARLDDGRPIVLVDARAPAEYAVSRLPGAVRIDPGASAGEVAAALGGRAEGADVVVYCSVGVRSSILADRAAEALRAAGAGEVANLRGGVFAWANAGRALETDTGPTARVHPYDKTWGRLLDAGVEAAYAP